MQKISLRRSVVPILVLTGVIIGTPAAAANADFESRSAAVAEAAEADAPVPVLQSPELAAIDYKILYRRLMQLGMLSQVLGYSLTVSADGQVIDCNFSSTFKSRFTRKQLCKAFIETTAFEPARDADGNAVMGTYEDEVEVASFFQPS